MAIRQGLQHEMSLVTAVSLRLRSVLSAFVLRPPQAANAIADRLRPRPQVAAVTVPMRL